MIFLPSLLLFISFTQFLERHTYDEVLADDQEEKGWKYILGDVFRYPNHKSLFAVVLGSGTQLFTL
jgi:hypothetical protein